MCIAVRVATQRAPHLTRGYVARAQRTYRRSWAAFASSGSPPSRSSSESDCASESDLEQIAYPGDRRIELYGDG